MYPLFDFPNSFKEFVKRCLLFISAEKFHWLLGIIGWTGILLLMLAFYYLMKIIF